MEFNEFLANLAQGLLVIALPILIAAIAQAWRVLAQRLGEKQLNTLNTIASIAVAVAERSGLTGQEKRDQAMAVAERFMKARGISVNTTELAMVIEAEVTRQFHTPTDVADTAATRQALIDDAVETAVLAAEQSGLAGLITDLGPVKKAYALDLARQYLSEHAIAISEDLIGGLIEARLLRFKLQGSATAQPDTGVSTTTTAAP